MKNKSNTIKSTLWWHYPQIISFVMSNIYISHLKNKFAPTSFICSCVRQNILLLKAISVLFRPWRSHFWFYIIHLYSELGLKTWFLWILYLGININSWKGVIWIFKWLCIILLCRSLQNWNIRLGTQYISRCWAYLSETFEVKCNLRMASRCLATTLRLGIVLLRI